MVDLSLVEAGTYKAYLLETFRDGENHFFSEPLWRQSGGVKSVDGKWLNTFILKKRWTIKERRAYIRNETVPDRTRDMQNEMDTQDS